MAFHPAALRSAFGADLPDNPPTRLPGGMSGAALYRLRVGGIAYLLRLEPETAPPFGDRTRAFAAMQIAAEACLAPRIRYADPQAGLTIMELIERQPVEDFVGGRTALVQELAQTVRLLHETPTFPEGGDFLDCVAALLHALEGHQDLTPRFARLREELAIGAEPVSSHNDLNPRNLLFDGRRLWLIDWDMAFLGDRFVDLAAIANGYRLDEAEIELLLATYFRQPPTPAQQRRLAQMREVSHLFYGLVFLLSAGPAANQARAPDLGLAALETQMANGDFDLHDAANRAAYGVALLAEAERMAGSAGALHV